MFLDVAKKASAASQNSNINMAKTVYKINYTSLCKNLLLTKWPDYTMFTGIDAAYNNFCVH